MRAPHFRPLPADKRLQLIMINRIDDGMASDGLPQRQRTQGSPGADAW
jgi:hypothetical protein